MFIPTYLYTDFINFGPLQTDFSFSRIRMIFYSKPSKYKYQSLPIYIMSKYNILFLFLICTITSFSQGVFEERLRNPTQYFPYSFGEQASFPLEEYNHLSSYDQEKLKNDFNQGFVYSRLVNMSGNVIFDCEASDYLNQIKSKLLEGNSWMDNLIHVYITRTPVLNAFATVDQNVYINIGLLAQLENEAQLAFVISHEISHVLRSHILDEAHYTRTQRREARKADIFLNKDVIELSRHELSREHELDADMGGLMLYLDKGYDPADAKKALELIRNKGEYTFELPLEDDYFFTQLSNINDLSQQIKRKQSIDKVNSRNAKSNENKAYQTHPSIEVRLDQLDSLLLERGDSLSGKKYLISESMFHSVQEEAKKLVVPLYAENMDFISLFQVTSYRYNKLANRSEENIGLLAYSLQGMLINAFESEETPDEDPGSYTSSMLFHFIYKEKDSIVANWVYNAMKQISIDNPGSEVINTYLEATVFNIYKFFGHLPEGIPDSELNFNDVVASESDDSQLYFKDIDFELNLQSLNAVKAFNQYKNVSSLQGRVAAVNSVYDKLDQYPLKSVGFPLLEVEDLQYQTDLAWNKMENSVPNDFMNSIPNGENYSLEKFELYTALNNWMSTAVFADGYQYVYYDKHKVDSLAGANFVDYALLNMNLQIKDIRKVTLTVIYDIHTGKLVFWDRRTFTQPTNKAQLKYLMTLVLREFNKRK